MFGIHIVKAADDDDPHDSRDMTYHGSYHGRKALKAQGNLRRGAETPKPHPWWGNHRRP